ncbi:MAG: hypothetical protein R6W91_03085 [Thermoplasmata archaeon]
MMKAKILSLALVSMMVMGAFGMMMPRAEAEYYNNADDRNIYISEESINNYDGPGGAVGGNFANYEIYPGTQNVNFDIRITNGGNPQTTPGTIYWCNLSINPSVLRNENGVLISSSYLTWDDPTVDEEFNGWATIGDNGGWNVFEGFQFDVANNARPGIYNLTVTLTYKDAIDGVATNSYIGFVLFEVRYRCDIYDIGGLIPGDMNKNVNVNVHFTSAIPSWWVHDLSLSVTLPDSDFWWFGLTGLTATQTTTTTYQDDSTWSPSFMISVSALKAKGTYTGTYSITYTTDGDRTITETGSIDFIVGDVAMLKVTIPAGQKTLAQGTTKVNWTLTFENVGTVDLLAIRCQLDDVSEAFTFMPADHWEGDETVSYNWLTLGDIDIGDTVTVSMEVGIDLYIPEGLHKVLFMFEGKYFDPASSNYRNVAVSWVDGGADGYDPYVNMGVAQYTLTPDSSSLEGPFIWIEVTDTEIDFMLTSLVTLTTAGRIMDNELQMNVFNYGNIDFANVVLQIQTNTATSPFMNVVNPTATLSEETPLGNLDAGDDDTISLRVSLKPDFDLGVYMVPVTVNAVNWDMGEEVSTVINARITIRGVGPQLEVTSVTPENIKRGASFTLTIEFTNVGDDTARGIIINSVDPAWFNEQTTISGNYMTPEASALPLYLGDVAPGATLTVEIPMRSNSDMAKGHVYSIVFELDYVDSFGYGPATDTVSVAVKSSGMGGSVLGTLYWSFVMLAIIISIFIIIVAVFYVKKNRAPKAQPAPVQAYQQPPPPQQDQQIEQ